MKNFAFGDLLVDRIRVFFLQNALIPNGLHVIFLQQSYSHRTCSMMYVRVCLGRSSSAMDANGRVALSSFASRVVLCCTRLSCFAPLSLIKSRAPRLRLISYAESARDVMDLPQEASRVKSHPILDR